MLAKVLWSNEMHRIKDKDACVVFVDVLRATSTIPACLAAGATEVLLSKSAPAALKMKKKGDIVCGERHGKKLKGFNYGNSPSILRNMDLSDKRVILSTGNFCRVITKVKNPCVAGSIVNAKAVGQYVMKNYDHVYIVATGTYRFKGRLYDPPRKTKEDLLGAMYILEIMRKFGNVDVDKRTLKWYKEFKPLLKGNLLDVGQSYEYTKYLLKLDNQLLKEKGRLPYLNTQDILLCFTPNMFDVVPKLVHGKHLSMK